MGSLNSTYSYLNETGLLVFWNRATGIAHNNVVVVTVSEMSCAMQNSRIKSRCLPLDLLDGWPNGQIAVRVVVCRGF